MSRRDRIEMWLCVLAYTVVFVGLIFGSVTVLWRAVLTSPSYDPAKVIAMTDPDVEIIDVEGPYVLLRFDGKCHLVNTSVQYKDEDETDDFGDNWWATKVECPV